MSDSEIIRLLNDARQLHGGGQLAEAERRYRAILSLDQDHADAAYLLGSLLLQQGNANGAIDLLTRARALKPKSVAVLVNLGGAYRTNKEPDKAVPLYEEAIALNPEIPEAYSNLGHVLCDQKEYAHAVTAYRRYVELQPQDVNGHLALADTLWRTGAMDEALDCFESVLAYDPAHIAARLNVACLLQEKALPHAGFAVLEALAQRAPEDAEVKKNFALALLQLGMLTEGWPKFEARFTTPTQRVLLRSTPPPYWRGEELTGKSILIWTEQGLGEEILYAGMFDEVVTKAKRCVIECEARLAPIFRRSFPAAEIAPREARGGVARRSTEVAQHMDFQIAAASLGQYLRKDFACFPQHTGYLRADPSKVRRIKRRYAAIARGRRIVGLSWRSAGPSLGLDKSAVLENLAPLLRQPDVLFVNLQYGDISAEVAAARQLGLEILNDSDVDAAANIDDSFAQTAAMDLVITTSNTTAHAAGAQNIPAWVLLPAAKGSLWYWFLQRDDSPWYPSVRLIRAPTPSPAEPWEKQIVDTVAGDLAALAKSGAVKSGAVK